MQSIARKLEHEINRVQKVVERYRNEDISGCSASIFIEQVVKRGQHALDEGNQLKMVGVYNELKVIQ